MPKDVVLLALLLCIIGNEFVHVSSSPAQSSAPSDSSLSELDIKEEIREVLRQFIDAWNGDDAARVAALFTEDGSFISPEGHTYRGREAIKRVLTEEHAELFMGTTLDETVRSLRLSAVDRAVIRGDFELNGVKTMFGLVTLSPQGSFLFRLRKEQNRWFLLEVYIAGS